MPEVACWLTPVCGDRRHRRRRDRRQNAFARTLALAGRSVLVLEAVGTLSTVDRIPGE